MVSRDTTVHATVVALALASMAALSRLAPQTDSALAVAAALGFNGAVLAGAHLYLARRGEDGIVPVSTRWRFVATVGVVLFLAGVGSLTDPVPVGPVTSDTLLTAAGVAVALAYLAVE